MCLICPLKWERPTLSPFYLMNYLKFNLIQFSFMQLLVYGVFILGINLKNLLRYPIEEIIKGGLFLIIIYFSLIQAKSYLVSM